MSDKGASNNESLLEASKLDQDDAIEDILKEGTDIDINFADSVGNTALHYAAQFGSLSCLDILVEVEGIKLDAKNLIDGDTPLHKAVKYYDLDIAIHMVTRLLECDADPRIQNRSKQTPLDLVDKSNADMIKLLKKGIASYNISSADIANDEDDDDDDDVPSDDE